ncbi:MAG: hypothetical protein ABI867_36075 [Kofleriaceae bacterium]
MKAVAILLALAACGGDGGSAVDAPPPAIDADPTVDAPPPREVKMSVEPLEAGEVLEAKMIGGGATSGDRAIVYLTAPSATLDWNIHSHPDGTTITVHEELGQMTVIYDFIPSEEAEWFLLLRNGGGVNMDVQVKIELFGAMTFGFI